MEYVYEPDVMSAESVNVSAVVVVTSVVPRQTSYCAKPERLSAPPELHVSTGFWLLGVAAAFTLVGSGGAVVS